MERYGDFRDGSENRVAGGVVARLRRSLHAHMKRGVCQVQRGTDLSVPVMPPDERHGDVWKAV